MSKLLFLVFVVVVVVVVATICCSNVVAATEGDDDEVKSTKIFNFTKPYIFSEEDAARYKADLLAIEEQGYAGDGDSNTNTNRRMISGHPLTDSEWRLTRPWEVQNVCDYLDGKGWIPCGCSSTIINKHYLITAGHCLNCPYTTKKVALRFSNGFIDEQVYQEIHNPKFQYGNDFMKFTCGVRNVISSDLGLQYLSTPLRFRYGVSPFPGLLERRFRDYQVRGVVAGWGASTQEGASFEHPVYSKVLNKLKEKVNANSECQKKIGEWFAMLDYVRGKPQGCESPFDEKSGAAELLCSSAKDINTISYSMDPVTFGVPNEPKGICYGDSGSPLVDPETEEVLGFVSDTLSTSAVAPCGYGIDIFTKFSEEKKHWVKGELAVKRPKNWVCPPKPTS